MYNLSEFSFINYKGTKIPIVNDYLVPSPRFNNDILEDVYLSHVVFVLVFDITSIMIQPIRKCSLHCKALELAASEFDTRVRASFVSYILLDRCSFKFRIVKQVARIVLC